MKTIFLINSLEKGGAERVVLTLLANINSGDANSIYLFLLEDNIKYDIPDNVQVFIGSRYNAHNILKLLKVPLLAFKLKRFCRKNQISTIISFLERSNFTNVIARILGSDHKCIISERNTPSLVYHSQQLKDRINRYLIRSLYPHADRVISVSDGVRRDLVENFGINQAVITKIHNPYEIDKIQQMSNELIDEEWLNNDSYQTILNVGSLTKQKGHDILVKVFARLLNKFENLRLIIVGDGVERQKLLSLLKDLGIESYVKLTGFKDNPYAYMSRADIFVLSSLYEGFPNVLIEAMICGCPVVSTDCRSGPNEIIKNRHNGVLLPVGDLDSMESAIREILEDKLFRQKLIKNARECVKQYQVSKITSEFLNVLNSPQI